MQTASAIWQVEQAAMFTDVTETDDLIRYGRNSSLVPPHFPDLGREGKRTGFPASRGLPAAFAPLGSILPALLCSTLQMFQEA